MKKKVNAKNGLGSFWSPVTGSPAEPKLKDNIKAEDKEKITKAVDDIIKWVDENPNAETEEFEAKQKELEEMWKPVMMGAYGQGQGGMPGGGMPGQGPAPGGPAQGPNIDEVD